MVILIIPIISYTMIFEMHIYRTQTLRIIGDVNNVGIILKSFKNDANRV